MLKLARRARGHFVTLIEIGVHLIRVKPGHINLGIIVDYEVRSLRELWRLESLFSTNCLVTSLLQTFHF